jgi:antitoxin StbD
MEQILSNRSVSISELKRSPSAVLANANNEPLAILNHNKPAAYLVTPQLYQKLLERFEESEIRLAIAESRADTRAPIAAETVFAELEASINTKINT